MLEQAFEEYQEELLSLPKNLPIAEWEPKINELLKKFQVTAGIKAPHLTVANLFAVRVNGTNPETQSLELPNDLNLTYLSQDPSGRKFPGYLNQMDILTNKIVDPITRELILMPLLVQNFNKPFKINDQMLELLSGLSCADGSRPKLDADSLNKTSAEFVDYLRRFQTADLPPNAVPMSLKQMYGILQSVEKFKSFGFTIKQPKAIGACSQGDFGSSPSQFLRFGLYPELEYRFYGDFQDGNIRFSREGIKQTYTIFHEILHMFLPGDQYFNADLKHIDDFKFFKPLLYIGNSIPATVMQSSYSSSIPKIYTEKGEIGLLDQLFVEAGRIIGKPYALPPGCDSQFEGPGSVFRKFCPLADINPKLKMQLPWDFNEVAMIGIISPLIPLLNTTMTTPTPQQSTQLNQSDNASISITDPIIMTEFYTALSRGALQIIATNLKLSKEKQIALLSMGENASRIGLIAYNENINSGIYVATFSGLATAIKMIDLGLKSSIGESFQEIAQDCVGKLSAKVIGTEMTNKIGNAISNTIGNTPEQLKTFASQLLFVFTIHSLSEISKNLKNKDDAIQAPKIEEKILIGLAASVCSALMGGIIKLGVDKFFSRSRPDSTINVGAEVSGGDVENSSQGGRNSAGEAGGPIEISAHLGVVISSTSPASAPQSPSRQLPPSNQREER